MTILSTENAFLLLMIIFVAGSVLPYIWSKKPKTALYLGCVLAAGGSLVGLLLGMEGLMSQNALTINLGNILPGVELELEIDQLGGFFLTTICLVTFITSIYSMQYMKMYLQENIAWWSLCYNLFIVSMILVVSVNNVITFLIFWELMTLSSYFLVTYSYKREFVRKAGFIYIVMTHIGTVFIASAFFLLLDPNTGWHFSLLASNSASLIPDTKNLIFIFALIGFGTKAGVVPLHVWLPMAHPAAPTNISAIMSGVMLKTAIYGMIRLIIDILGVGPAWWGALIVILGLISAIAGIISAIMQRDLKKMLAYSSVENVGIILIALGVSLIFASWQMVIPAGIALAAGLFHVFNHAVFKSLLFLSTGSIYFSTHTKDMEQLGGLIKKMPYTAILFLVGAVAISALPPLSGFASEYQIYLSLLTVTHEKVSFFWTIGSVLTCAGLALTGALAAACFVKAFGISFLALPRSEKANHAAEVPKLMRISMIPLAVLCVVIGMFPGVLFNHLTKVYAQITGQMVFIPQNIDLSQSIALSSAMIMLILILFALSRSGIRKTETWGCGIEVNASMEYTAGSFSQPIRRLYSPFLRPEQKTYVHYNFLRYFNFEIYFQEHIGSVINNYLYKPARGGIIYLSKKWRVIQSGNINLYLSYIFLTLIALLIWA